MAAPLLIARHSATECLLLPALANRHGLITGATGTGKTVTLQKMAEGFSEIGVPEFMADIKGDLSGISQPGSTGARSEEHTSELQSQSKLVCRLLLAKKKNRPNHK